jgi:hypothetical protein
VETAIKKEKKSIAKQFKSKKRIENVSGVADVHAYENTRANTRTRALQHRSNSCNVLLSHATFCPSLNAFADDSAKRVGTEVDRRKRPRAHTRNATLFKFVLFTHVTFIPSCP